RKGSDFDSDSMRLRIDGRLRQSHPKSAYAAGRSHSMKDRAGDGLLEVIASSGGDLDDLAAQEIVVPGKRGIVFGWAYEIVEPDLLCHKQPLRRADLKLMEANVHLHFERFEQDPRRADLQIGLNQAGQLGLDPAHSPRR